MMSFLDQIREIRETRSAGKLQIKSNTKNPIYRTTDQQTLYNRVRDTLPDHYAVFWRLAIATGWRTSDLCSLKFSSVDLNTGLATITVSKQTKQAEKRAYTKHLQATKAAMQKAAAAAGDYSRFMRLESLPLDDRAIADELAGDEISLFYSELESAVLSAKKKVDTKAIPPSLLPKLRQMKAANMFDDFIFSRRMIKGSNRAVNSDGHITRQSVHRAFRAVFDWFTSTIDQAAKLSAYSLRKTFAYRLYTGADGDQHNIGEVMELFGHSSINMTMKYLGLSSTAEKMQRELAGLT